MYMAPKKAYLISCSDHYKFRLNVIDESIKALGYETTYLTSNYDHDTKSVFVSKVEGVVQIPVRPYEKNLSADRILSHREFAKKAFAHLESLEQQPDLLLVHIPPNFLAHYAGKYKKRHPQVKLVFDIFDLWPESLPGGRIKKLLAPVFSVWAALRDKNLDKADYVITECEMFRQKLTLPAKTSQTVWLCGEALPSEKLQPQLSDDAITLCYLGSINNIIGTEDICGLIRQLSAQKKVILHIIGKGETQQEFCDAAQDAGAEVIFHGAVYDESKKLEILNQCHFGLNIMKSSVCVGLTMKSVEYFRFGLPIINSIPGDTTQLVQQKGIGIQLEEGCAEKLLALTSQDCLRMRSCVEQMFAESFEHSVVCNQYTDILKRI